MVNVLNGTATWGTFVTLEKETPSKVFPRWNSEGSEAICKHLPEHLSLINLANLRSSGSSGIQEKFADNLIDKKLDDFFSWMYKSTIFKIRQLNKTALPA